MSPEHTVPRLSSHSFNSKLDQIDGKHVIRPSHIQLHPLLETAPSLHCTALSRATGALFTGAAVPGCLLLPFVRNLDFPSFNWTPHPIFQLTGLDLNHYVSGCASGKHRGRICLTDNTGIWHFHQKQSGDRSIRISKNCTRGCCLLCEHREPGEHRGGRTGRVKPRGGQEDSSSPSTAQCDHLMEKNHITAHLSPPPDYTCTQSWVILNNT